MLSSLEPKQVSSFGDECSNQILQSIKGIGAKTAQRAILDLKDKVLKIYDLQSFFCTNNTNKDEALSGRSVRL
jgi:Holliday junction DNA helicase RuvA